MVEPLHRPWSGGSTGHAAWRTHVVHCGVVVAAALAWALVPSPEGWPWVVAMGLVMYGILLGAVVRTVDLDVEGGRLLQRRLWVLRRGVAWPEVAVLRLRHNFAGVVMLQVRPARALTSVWVPVVADDRHGPRGLAPAVLRLLAAEVRRCAPVRHHPVADELEAQAAHLEGGGGLRDSPVLRAHSGFRIT